MLASDGYAADSREILHGKPKGFAFLPDSTSYFRKAMAHVITSKHKYNCSAVKLPRTKLPIFPAKYCRLRPSGGNRLVLENAKQQPELRIQRDSIRIPVALLCSIAGYIQPNDRRPANHTRENAQIYSHGSNATAYPDRFGIAEKQDTITGHRWFLPFPVSVLPKNIENAK
jgi:hypothetical protein